MIKISNASKLSQTGKPQHDEEVRVVSDKERIEMICRIFKGRVVSRVLR